MMMKFNDTKIHMIQFHMEDCFTCTGINIGKEAIFLRENIMQNVSVTLRSMCSYKNRSVNITFHGYSSFP